MIAVLAGPVMPNLAQELWTRLGGTGPVAGLLLPDAGRWGLLEPGTATTKGESLFPRRED